MNIRLISRITVPLVIAGSAVFWVYWVPLHIEAALPPSMRQWLDRGDTPALLVLFLVVPVCLVVLVCVAAVFVAIILRPFVSRSQAKGFILAMPTGGHIGSLERSFLRIFKDRLGD